MSANWTQYFEYRDDYTECMCKSVKRYVYKDKSVIKLPADLPMPPTDGMFGMFSGCEQLQDISALANWDVSKVKDMSYTFAHCYQLQDITALANWDVSKVKYMRYMFSSCKRLWNIASLANWDVSNIVIMAYMFSGCEQLYDLKALANWDVSDVNDMSYMFQKCGRLQNIDDLAHWDVSKVERIYNMFLDCQLPYIYNKTDSIKSYLRELSKRYYIKQDHTQLLNSLWERVKPLLKHTTRLNGYFKRYTIEDPIINALQKENAELKARLAYFEERMNDLTSHLNETVKWNP